MIYHIMKDGAVKTDITGHMVPIRNAESLYQLMSTLNHSSRKRKKSK